MVKAVVFDLDDTLISEKEYIKSGYHYIAKELSTRIEISEDIIFSDLMELFHQSPKHIFNRLYEKYDVEYSQEMIMQLVNAYRGHYPEIEFFDDVLPCLNELKNKNIKMGVITDGYVVAQQQKLRAVEAEKYFDEIILTDELGRDYWKPSPKAFELMREKLEVEFEDMVYIGDNPEKDFFIITKYPIKTVRVYRNGFYKNKNYMDNIKELLLVPNLIDITEILAKVT